MKKFIPILFLVLACDDLLDIEAENALSGNLLTDETTIQQALNGAYLNLMGINDGSGGGELLGGDFQMMATLLARTDRNVVLQGPDDEFIFVPPEISWDAAVLPEFEEFVDKSLSVDNSRIASNWSRGYQTISIVNEILENIENVSDSNERERIRGEAMAIRGILYFEMVRLWGPQYSSSTQSSLAIPLLLEPIKSLSDIGTVEKSTVGAIYNQVETDLNTASGLLQDKTITPGDITYFVCQAYLGRVSLQKGDFNTAVGYLNEVINNGGFMLTTTPAMAFNNASNSSEDIFAVQQTIASNTGDPGSLSGLSTYFNSFDGTGLGALFVFPDQLNRIEIPNNPEFDDIDLRAQVTTGVSSAGEVAALYYSETSSGEIISSAKYLSNTNVVPLIRLSEMYLSRAEAIHEQNFSSPINAAALSDLNAIRTRAGLPALLDTLSEFQFYDSLLVERNRELIYEGIIFHDLKRWAEAGNSVEIAYDVDPLSDDVILPIPESECDASPGLCD